MDTQTGLVPSALHFSDSDRNMQPDAHSGMEFEINALTVEFDLHFWPFFLIQSLPNVSVSAA